ncbi:sugar porter family MFS transporter [Blastopirellula sp. JC732]|uniref:Sugar porter family MFS transporter n=1 Tax=Blastopirellula sediminis TaxID=2894196 RepID=A0A9X1MRK6_9BACT|nr:sugar porter family MFS transporter [Blastopirellula sediminis]MCC9605244.1 sugar porter family MFS transporter [Blastopirellula sediminis]MCC9631456.1 sugar porter family MFS transporter [Blastopirellula sediminis]
MTSRLFYWSLTSALAGFLFGFDTVVISGAEQTIEKLWDLDKLTHGLAMSAALWGTVLGSLIGGWPTDAWGRRKTLISIGALYFVSAVWSGLATDVYSFMIARFIGGLGVGISTVAAPLYISEISPPERRGRLAAMFQFNIVFGILIAFASNALLSGIGDTAWRWMLGVEAFPAVLYTLMCFTLPESPRWLIAEKNDREEGLRVLRLIAPERNEAEIETLAGEIESATTAEKKSIAGFWSRRLMKPILLAFLVAFFNQMSGINAILYFAKRIFESALQSGDAEMATEATAQAALMASVGVGVVNLIFTFAGLWLIDRLGRKTLLFIGSIGYIVSLLGCSWATYNGHFELMTVGVYVFIASHAVGQGAVIWVLISEVFPNLYRAMGQSLGSFTHWIFAALITLFFPYFADTLGMATIFLFFAGMMVLQLIWVITMVPETKGVPLEEMERKLGVTT